MKEEDHYIVLHYGDVEAVVFFGGGSTRLVVVSREWSYLVILNNRAVRAGFGELFRFRSPDGGAIHGAFTGGWRVNAYFSQF